MPRLALALLRRASRISPHVATLLPVCRDLGSARNELRWIRDHVASGLPVFTARNSAQQAKAHKIDSEVDDDDDIAEEGYHSKARKVRRGISRATIRKQKGFWAGRRKATTTRETTRKTQRKTNLSSSRRGRNTSKPTNLRLNPSWRRRKPATEGRARRNGSGRGRESTTKKRRRATARNSSSRKTERRIARVCQLRGRLAVPLQYLLGSQPFGTLDIVCRPGVLIPRPETEAWAHRLAVEVERRAVVPPPQQLGLSAAAAVAGSESKAGGGGKDGGKRKGKGRSEGRLLLQDDLEAVLPPVLPPLVRVLDFCTGTGCVGLALSGHLLKVLERQRPERKGFRYIMRGYDVSKGAVELAKLNLSRNSAEFPGQWQPDVENSEEYKARLQELEAEHEAGKKEHLHALEEALKERRMARTIKGQEKKDANHVIMKEKKRLKMKRKREAKRLAAGKLPPIPGGKRSILTFVRADLFDKTMVKHAPKDFQVEPAAVAAAQAARDFLASRGRGGGVSIGADGDADADADAVSDFVAERIRHRARHGKVDVLVANPPYVSAEGYHRDGTTSRSVRRHEPVEALVPPDWLRGAADAIKRRFGGGGGADGGGEVYCRHEDIFYARLLEVAGQMSDRDVLRAKKAEEVKKEEVKGKEEMNKQAEAKKAALRLRMKIGTRFLPLREGRENMDEAKKVKEQEDSNKDDDDDDNHTPEMTDTKTRKTFTKQIAMFEVGDLAQAVRVARMAAAGYGEEEEEGHRYWDEIEIWRDDPEGVAGEGEETEVEVEVLVPKLAGGIDCRKDGGGQLRRTIRVKGTGHGRAVFLTRGL